MAINVSGSKTLTKLSLGSSLTVDISHNYNLFQVYDPNTNAFAPDWSSTDTPLNLKAIAYYNGKDVTSEATYEWTSCYDSSSEVSSVGTNKELVINTNVLQGHTSITYTVKVTYNKLTATNDITFTLINAGKDGQNGDEAAEHFVSISGEQIFKYDKDKNVLPATITLTATTKNVTISKWYYLNGEKSVDLNNDGKTTITINPTDACFIGNQALIKVTTNYSDVFDIYNLAKLYDGTNGTNGKNGSTVTVTQKEGITTITTTDSNGNSTSVDVKDGEDGTPGSQGADGKTPFIHIKYSNDGKTFTPATSTAALGETPSDWLGQYTDYTEADSEKFDDYKWTKIKGKNGTAMQTFYRYANSIPTSDADLQDTSKVSESPSYTDNGTIKYYTYIGQAIATATAGADITAPTSWSAWKWSYFKGEDAYSAILSNMNMSFRVDKDNNTISAIKETCDVTVYKGTSPVAFTLGVLPDGVSSPIESNSNNSRTLTISIAKGTLLAASGTFTIPITEPIITNLEIKWTTVKDGIEGRGVSSITNYYYLSDSNEAMDTPTSLDGWSTSFSNPTINNRYLWNCEYIKYTDNTNFITTPAIINSYAQDGKSIKSITEEYAITSNTTAPTESSSWSTDIPVLSNGEYLWKQETITYEQTGKAGTSITTSPVMIGYSGIDGKSITGVINYYLASANGSGIVKDKNTWYTDPSKTEWNATNKYLWNYEEITYSNNTSSYTAPCIIGTYAADGKGISSIIEEYAITAKAEEPAESEWNSEYLQPTDEKPFVWNRQTITYTSGNPTVTSRIVCVKGVDGVNGGRWYSGTVMNGGTGTTQVYASSGITSAVIGDMYFNTSTNDTYRCTIAGDANTAKWTYVANIKGKQGDPGIDAYFLTLYAANGTIFNNGTGKLTVKANFYQGTTLLSGGTYSWTMTKMGDSGFYTAKITDTNDTITINASDVTGYTTITCTATKGNISRAATVSLTDKTDGFIAVKELPTANINNNAIYLVTSDSEPKLYRRNADNSGWVLITDINTVNSFIDDTKTRFSKLLTDDNKLALNFNFANPQASTVSTEGIHLVGEKGTFNVDNSQLAFYDENNVLRLGFGTTESGSTSFQVKGNVTAEKFIATTDAKTYNDNDTKLAFTVDGGTMSFAKTLLKDDNNENITDPTAEKLLWYENGNLNIKGAITASSLKIGSQTVNEYVNTQAKEALSSDLDTINSSIADVQSSVDNIQIGGRNLLRNSNFANNLDSWDDWGTTSTKEIVSDANNKKWCGITGIDTADYQGICQKITFIKNTPLILSFSAYSEVEETPFRTIIHQRGGTTGNGPQIANIWTLTTTPTRYKVSFTSSDDSSKSTFNLMFGPPKTTNKVYITDIKFEQGNKVTDWSPAPEDVDDGIMGAQSMASDNQAEIGAIYDTIRDNINEPLSTLTQYFTVTNTGEAKVAAYEGNTEVASVRITSTSINISLKDSTDVAIYGPDYIKLGKMKIQSLDNKGLIFSTWQ